MATRPVYDLKADEVSLECAFQSSKVFEHGGSFRDLLSKTSREAKKDDRLKSSGRLVKFNYDDIDFSLEPKTFFYDWLYMKFLSWNEVLKTVFEF